MKIKIGHEIYDGNDIPVMIILTEQDKKNIANMLPECTKYCQYPEEYNDTIDEWIGEA